LNLEIKGRLLRGTARNQEKVSRDLILAPVLLQIINNGNRTLFHVHCQGDSDESLFEKIIL
jgi:hypothetical protein